MTFKGIARFASVLFGRVVVATVVTTWSLISQSYSISVEEEKVDDAQTRVDQLSALPGVLAERCESQLLDPDIEVARSCQDLEKLPSRISSATNTLVAAEDGLRASSRRSDSEI